LKTISHILLITAGILLASACNKDEPSLDTGWLQLVSVKAGDHVLQPDSLYGDIPVNTIFTIRFSTALDTATLAGNLILVQGEDSTLPVNYSCSDGNSIIEMVPVLPLSFASSFRLILKKGLRGASAEKFPGITYTFTTGKGLLQLNSLTLNGNDFLNTKNPTEIDFSKVIIIAGFSQPLPKIGYQSYFVISGNANCSFSLSEDARTVTIQNGTALKGYSRYFFTVSSNLKSEEGYAFSGFSNSFYTGLDTTPKFPLISDDELLTLIQQQTFRYFYDFAHPSCGLARERNNSGDVVTIGGSGFGIMSLIVGIERGFITRDEGLTRLEKIISFLETCDRYHGVWPHWIDGKTKKTVPFSTYDNGGDLVETSFMIQGLITMKQYLDSTIASEKQYRDRISSLCNTVEYDWYTQNQNALFWHWSPNYGWKINMKLQGYNETLITYVLAASSPTHSINKEAYTQGYARNGGIKNGSSFYGTKLPLGEAYGGPLFFTHYSFLGLDPRHLSDAYANYWEQNVNHATINWSYCVANPKKFMGYREDCWGLTASDNNGGYSAHSPTNDLGVISPTAAVSSIPYTPEKSLAAIRHFYFIMGDKLWGTYGFYDAFNISQGWYASSYLAIDQGPIICMIENYRSGLLWNLFMSSSDVQNGLTKLGFTY
jgi:hypothetical protein